MTKPAVLIREIGADERAAWEPLWQGYLQFYESSQAKDATDETWRRIHDPNEPMFALGSYVDGKLLGIVQYLFHRSFWTTGDYCYLQDLFVAKDTRGLGLGRALIEAVYAKAKEKGASRVHWLTQDHNATARLLYDNIADRSGLIQYRKIFSKSVMAGLVPAIHALTAESWEGVDARHKAGHDDDMLSAMTESRAFLGVERSVSGRVWRDRLDLRGTQAATAISQHHGIPELLARVLAGRGVTPDEVEDFLDPTVRRLMPDPNVMTDMEQAASRLADAVQHSEQIAIIGDYDVDGATSTALMVRTLRAAGNEPFFHIPDRMFEGYGPNIEAIRNLDARGASLLVTLDCGTTSAEALGEASKLGLDVVVVDHHQAGETLPIASALVNPNREDDLSGLGHLCAAGLTFMTCVALVRELRKRGHWSGARVEPDLLQLLDLVALGTVADVVPLKGLNRAFVTKGLISLRNRENHGLRALMDAAKLEGPPECWHLGFLLGPRINAGGRIGDATLGTKLLTTNDPAEANAIAQKLDALNRERQVIEKETLAAAEAEALAALGHDEQGAIVVASGEGWHPGVVGLVAARLKEKFSRPAFAIAMLGQQGTGSGRSIAGVDIGRAVRGAVEEGLLLKGGGHAMAAGLTVTRDKLGDLRAYLDAHLRDAVEKSRHEDCLEIDAAITARGANGELFAMIERAGPYGSGNPEPVFALPAHTVAFADPVGQGHVRARLRSNDGGIISAVAFRAADRPLGQALLASRNRVMHVAGTLSVNRWQGRETIEMRMLDASPADPLAAR